MGRRYRRAWWEYFPPIIAGGLIVACVLLRIHGWLWDFAVAAFLLAIVADLATGIARW